MGADTKGIILGEPDTVEIAALVRGRWAVGGEVVVRRINESVDELIFPVEGDRYHRMMLVSRGSSDDLEVVGDRPSTRLSLGAWGKSVPIIESIVSQYGGFVLDDDGKDDDWRIVEAAADAGHGSPPLSPLDQFLIDANKAVSFEEAKVMLGIASDPAKLDALMAAFARVKAADAVGDLEYKVELLGAENDLLRRIRAKLEAENEGLRGDPDGRVRQAYEFGYEMGASCYVGRPDSREDMDEAKAASWEINKDSVLLGTAADTGRATGGPSA